MRKQFYLYLSFFLFFLTFTALTPTHSVSACDPFTDPNCVPRAVVLQRYFVIEYFENCVRIYDVTVSTTEPDVFDGVMRPVRLGHPNLHAYNSQSTFMRALGEIFESELQDAIANGKVQEVSRTLIWEVCDGAGPDFAIDEDRPERCGLIPYNPIDSSPLDYTLLDAFGELPVFADLHPVEEGCEYDGDALAEFLPESMMSTMLVVDEGDLDEVLQILGMGQ